MERASNVLLSNVRLNKKTGNRRKRTGWTKHDETGNKWTGREEQVNGAQPNGKQNGTCENAARKRATQRTGWKRGTSDAQKTGKRERQDGRVERVAPNQKGNTGRNGRETIKQRAGSSGSTMLADHSKKVNKTN